MSTPVALEASPVGVSRIRWLAVLVVAGVAGWLSFSVLIGRMYAQTPPGAGFDLELLLTGGRRVAAGLSPYEPAMLAGQSVGITTLFYSYPPLVAQALAPLAQLPSVVVLAALLVLAPLLAAAVCAQVARVCDAALTRNQAFVLTLAMLPFFFPFTLSLLFGNLDALFVALYGLVLIAVLPASPSRRAVAAAGVAVAIATLTKLHPAVLGVWLVARGLREWRRGEPRVLVAAGLRLPRSWAIAGVAVLVGVLVLAASLVAGGVGPWADYVTVLRASTIVDLLDPRNLGPAVQVALALGLDASALAPLQAVALGVALVIAFAAAVAVDDPLESLLWASCTSMIVLPVTWFHHFAVLVPFGVASLARGWTAGAERRRRLVILTGLAFAVGAIGFGTVVAWLLVPIAIAMARVSGGRDGHTLATRVSAAS